MQDLRGKVAVITGGASGIGRAFAERAQAEGMRLVIADVEQSALDATAHALQNAGAELLAVRTDVSKAEQVDALARQTIERFGAVHVLFNNAGVSAGGYVWQNTLADWQWVLGVNLYGVIHGIRSFVPLMLAQNSEAHIVNTASMAGLVTTPGLGAYNVSKHGVVTLSETLALELAQLGAPIKVSVLCPGWVNTRIIDAARNRPDDLQNAAAPPSPAAAASAEAIRQRVLSGIPAEQVADDICAAIRAEKFYILTHPTWKPLIRQRMQAILDEQQPANGLGRPQR